MIRLSDQQNNKVRRVGGWAQKGRKMSFESIESIGREITQDITDLLPGEDPGTIQRVIDLTVGLIGRHITGGEYIEQVSLYVGEDCTKLFNQVFAAWCQPILDKEAI